MTAEEILSQVLKKLVAHTRPGVRTLTLNHLAEKFVRENGGVCYNKGYKPNGWGKGRFPAAVCININSQIAHGIPSEYKLKEGDLVSYDMGVLKDGLCADAALTVGVGEINEQNKKLIKAAKKALYAGIAKVKDGVTVREVAEAIEGTAKRKGFVVNRSLCGHAIGKHMHEEPFIYHCTNFYYNNRKAWDLYEKFMNIKLKEGMRICLEPMLTFGDKSGELSSNGWTWVTRDNKPSAIFEHMLEITKTGCNILTTHIEAPTMRE